ncbi:MAG TPA: CRISPR-associated endonuclease Cas1, partial [Verrucomicrobiae bacterium]
MKDEKIPDGFGGREMAPPSGLDRFPARAAETRDRPSPAALSKPGGSTLRVVVRVERAEGPGQSVAAGHAEPEATALSPAVGPSPAGNVSEREPMARARSFGETIPARMLNEYVYCPRLFYYEFVEGVFVESADTVRGSSLHRRVDSGSGGLPAADSKVQSPKAEIGSKGEAGVESEVIHSRSVQMGSEELGVSAKMDLVEARAVLTPEGRSASVPPAGSGGVSPPSSTRGETPYEPAGGTPAPQEPDLFTSIEVCPVDYKAGAPREGEDANELWETDKMQLGLQVLILRENGYACREGVIYYRGTKQRVRLEVTAELEKWIRDKIVEARRVAAGAIPAPLVKSSKCVRCSLAPVCLPDETRMLAGAEQSGQCREEDDSSNKTDAEGGVIRPRRLMAARDDNRPLYLNTQGFRVGCSDEVLRVKDKERVVEEVRLRDVSHVALFGNIQISTQAIQALCEQEVPVTYFSMGGWFYGITRGHELKNVFLRMEQFRLARDEATCLRLARQIVHGKIRNHRTMIMRNHLEPPEPTVAKLKRAAEDALTAGSIEELLGMEGAAASQYFQQFSGMIKAGDELAGLSQGEGGAGGESQLAFNFNFAHRNRRPPTDPVNAMLSLAYSLLTKDCTLAALAVGFDPY